MISARNLTMRFGSGGRELTVLDGVTLTVTAGEVVAVTGPSGSGKSTLLGLLAGLDRPSAGELTVAGVDVAHLGETALARFRRDTVGVVFQSYHLIPTLTAVENVAVPLELAGLGDALARAGAALEAVGLGDRVDHYPAQLSGGEQQRVAIARAVIRQPPVLLADEPTGNLDTTTGGRVIELLLELNQRLGSTLVLVTHDVLLAERADRIIALRDGRVVAPELAAT
jgi:putative ABC transport system ATP-binding protein